MTEPRHPRHPDSIATRLLDDYRKLVNAHRDVWQNSEGLAFWTLGVIDAIAKDTIAGYTPAGRVARIKAVLKVTDEARKSLGAAPLTVANLPPTPRPELSWHYGPTATDADPGKMWHYGCGQEVFGIDGGYVCGCGAQSPPDPDPSTMWGHGDR